MSDAGATMRKIDTLQNKANALQPPAPREAMPAPAKQEYRGKRVEGVFKILGSNGFLSADTNDQRALAEQYRGVKRPILRNADPRRDPPLPNGNLLMVASALAGEGKTFACIHLALSMIRERDWSVVLIDCDCSKRHLTRVFGAENEPGVIDLLRDSTVAFDSLVMPTNLPGFSVLPVGARDENAVELLASRRMSELCNQVASQVPDRIIIFDSSPLLLASEAAGLASHVGQIALVVRADSTPQTAVHAALEKLDPDKAIGCVLNQSSHGAASGYGYGYGYGYGSEGA
ncbi:MAG: protein tyrosine kinase [Gammaproteobacteria bacterium]